MRTWNISEFFIEFQDWMKFALACAQSGFSRKPDFGKEPKYYKARYDSWAESYSLTLLLPALNDMIMGRKEEVEAWIRNRAATSDRSNGSAEWMEDYNLFMEEFAPMFDHNSHGELVGIILPDHGSLECVLHYVIDTLSGHDRVRSYLS